MKLFQIIYRKINKLVAQKKITYYNNKYKTKSLFFFNSHILKFTFKNKDRQSYKINKQQAKNRTKKISNTDLININVVI
jgi:hypothetical protein